MKTKSTKKSEIKRNWHFLNAQDKILGRLSTEIALLLTGKNKPYFVPHLDCGDYVVVTNAARVKVTGKKQEQKKYYRHSGYPGGFKELTFSQQMAKDSRKIISHAVSGMLPQNKLRDKRLARLKIFVNEKHPYGNRLGKKDAKK